MSLEPITKRRPARYIYRDIKANIEKLEKTLLELLRHPLATAEQIDAARQTYIELKADMPRIRRHLVQKKLINEWEV